MASSSSKGYRTRLIHAGESGEKGNVPSAPPIVPSATFVMPPAHVDAYTDPSYDWTNHLTGAEEVTEYARHTNPTIRMLEQKVAAAEEAEAAAVFGSGMAAATAVLLHRLRAGDRLVLADVCYVSVSEFAHDTLAGLGVEVVRVDPTDLDAVRAAVRPGTTLVYIESPTNPIMRLTDIAAVAEIARAAGAETVVDSTFATPLATRPLDLGADWVIHSLTKYFSGHGDALGGAVVASAERIRGLWQDSRIRQGGVLSPFDAWLIARGMDTLPIRMAVHEASAFTVARFLEAHPKVTRVMYPGLPSHPQHELARRQMRNMSGMLTFQVEDGAQLARIMARQLRVFQFAVSLGQQRSLLFYIPAEHVGQPPFHLSEHALRGYQAFGGKGLFRVSVGLEDAEDLCDDLAASLAMLP